MKKALLPVVAALCFACVDVTDVDDLLLLTLSGDRGAIAVNDTVNLRITLSNHGDRDLDVPNPGCGPFFIVLDSLDRKFIPPQHDCSAASLAATIRVPANDSVTFLEPWAGEAQASNGEIGRLAPATYSVVAIMYGTHRRFESRSVHITLLPP